ncbi:hexokinase [Aspergillus lentulus]|uniref:Phosphotransferase n=1 Tax=Aspergillus lentulus TaxID=293939 RepID=A0AAN4T7D8_ASPLE|nr:hexokinase [Aspergillus lentulus]
MEKGLRTQPDLLSGAPEKLVVALQGLEELFAADRFLLRKITDHLVKEMEKGLSAEGGDIPMNVTWVMGYPTGKEQGKFLILDMGGTNLRVSQVELFGSDRDMESIQEKYSIPQSIKQGTADDLWDFVADCVQKFLQSRLREDERSKVLPLAFTFSYPVIQSSIKVGVLQRWTKDFCVSGVEGHDVVFQLEAAFERKQIPVRVVALINDTVGTLFAAAYGDREAKIGGIASTGCNAAYMEEIGAIPKIQGCGLSSDALVAINTEYGAFDNSRRILPRTRFDDEIDRTSAHPGQQLYEKMVAGPYLGELLQLVMLELHEAELLFVGQDVSCLRQPNAVDASIFPTLEEDIGECMESTRKWLWEKMGLDPAPHELKACRHLAELVGTRAARLYACGIAAICKKRNIESCHVGVDGSIFGHYQNYRKRAAQALRDIFAWPDDLEDPIVFGFYKDGSGVGAALIAALAVERSDGTVLSRTE